MKSYFKYICMLLIYIITTIIPIKVNATGIILNNSSLILGPNAQEYLGYSLSDNLNSSDIIWKSSNSEIITVDNGVIKAVAPEGSATITATINGNSSTCRVTISPDYVPVSGISLNTSSISILVGTTETLTKTISPSNATNKDVTWHSSDPEIATINSSGIITSKKLGTTIITVRASNGDKTTCRVTVVDTIALNDISLNKNSLTIKEQESETLSVTFNPSNATNKKVTWKSSNTKIATVDSMGKVTGVKPGTATITVISNDGGYVGICKVTIEEISKKVTSVTLDKEEINIMAGEKENLHAIIEPDYAENKNIIWTSSNENVAIVENGVVTAIAAGTAEIKVKSEDENKESICKVTVTSPPLKGLSFSTPEQTVYIGSETSLNVIVEPINATLENLIWKSSDNNIATVEDGKVLALSLGETTITVSNKDNTLTSSIKIIVIDKPEEELNITIEGYNLNFDPEVKNYNLTIKDEESLMINTNIDKDKVTINGNQNLKNGSIITITIMDEEKLTYIINIKKKNYTIYFIAIIVVLLIINLVRMIKNKKQTQK